MNELETLKKKIIYRANYRGTKEMDLLLGKFVDKYINSFSKIELQELFEFLNLEDEIIYNFYISKKLNKKLKRNKIFDYFVEFKI